MTQVLTDLVNGAGNEIGRVRLSVRPSIRLFPLQLLNQASFTLIFSYLNVYMSWPYLAGISQELKVKVISRGRWLGLGLS